MRDARLIRFGRDDIDVVREAPRDPLQNGEARRMNAIVVGDQNSH